RQAEAVNDPSDKYRIQVAEVSRHHDHGTGTCEVAKLLYFSDDLNLVAERVLAAEDGAEFLYAGTVQQATKPELYDLACNPVRIRFEVPGDLIGVPVRDAVKNFICLALRVFGRLPAKGQKFLFDGTPENRFVRRVYTPAIALHALLLTVNGSLQFVGDPFYGWAKFLYTGKSFLRN